MAPDAKTLYPEGGTKAVGEFEAGRTGFESRSFRGLNVVVSEPFEVADGEPKCLNTPPTARKYECSKYQGAMSTDWKQSRIPGVFVSSTGMVKRWCKRKATWTPAYLPLPDPKGYRYVSAGTSKRPVHQLVADAFLGPAPEGTSVDHLNRDQ